MCIRDSFSGLNLFSLGGIIAIIYAIWAIGNFYGKKKIGNYLKALCAYLIGFITFMISLGIIAFIGDLIIKK